ncbi:hypothetical protein Aph01nite_67560 [Acrocarpospora phusangensis]|uniref:Uncharacterized protein n=1 Tax=Acrocarpospora phusangensis TaxID=1070424 RepID=A0A919QIG1_9ACTN|nr:hypothetical protein Aph01nite_67560 [Acrocarpospora phusangensis]
MGLFRIGRGLSAWAGEATSIADAAATAAARAALLLGMKLDSFCRNCLTGEEKLSRRPRP